jgi:hypothetical protein
MEVAESAADLLIYKELDYSCIHGGKHFTVMLLCFYILTPGKNVVSVHSK